MELPSIEVPRLLLVEDDRDDAELTRLALTRAHIGNSLTVAHDAESALELLLREADGGDGFGFILLDLGLPGMDGREFLRRLAADPRLRQIPVVVLTGSDSDEDMLRSYKSGAVAFLRKPINVDRLLGAMAKIPDHRLLIARLPPRG